ncbi:hypothetical protein EJB05_30185, partial [Eragrostis curvula]
MPAAFDWKPGSRYCTVEPPTMPTLRLHQCTKLFIRVMQSILAAGTLAVMVTGEDDLTHRSPAFEPLYLVAALQLLWSLVRIFVELGELHGEQLEKPLAASVNTVGDSDMPPMKLSSYELTRSAVLMVMARASICGQLTLVIQSLVNN